MKLIQATQDLVSSLRDAMNMHGICHGQI